MIKLDDIPKKTLFEVPDGYFDRLPGLIQARTAKRATESLWAPYSGYALKFALPAVALFAVAVFIWNGPAPLSAEDVLASIDSEQLVAYLAEGDMNTDDLLEALPLDPDEIDAIEENTMEELNMDDKDLESLSDEFDVIYN